MSTLAPINDPEAAIKDYLAQHESKSMLRFLTCGSVDDGKSTLLGRLLYDTQLLFDDQVATLEGDSRRHGTQGSDLDFALLVDGLSAEREQGITIDVAYRFFSTEKRQFIVADCPGHEEYTRNMVTGASTTDLAVVLVDARQGLLTQTRRHTWICSLLGINHVLLAVNKMDLVDFDETKFRKIALEYQTLAQHLGIENVTAIPVSALKGDNISQHSDNTPWYKGPTLLKHLESVNTAEQGGQLSFRMPVQWVCRPDHTFRGFAGQVVEGQIAPGDEVVVLPSAKRSKIKRIVTADGDLSVAKRGSPITLVLADEIDVSRGDVIASTDNPPQLAEQFAAHTLWLSAQALLPGRPYRLKIGAQIVNAKVSKIKHRIDVNTQQKLDAQRLQLNEVGYCHLELDQPIAFETYQDSQQLGAFILIDRISNATVAAGTIDSALRKADNIHWQATTVNRQSRAYIKGQQPSVVWFTGLSGSGKSTIADQVERQLHAKGYHTYLLDGDNVRHGLNKDLGFSLEQRQENIRRVAEMAKLMADAGLIVLVSFISPSVQARQQARALIGQDVDFIEAYVNTPLEVCESRDVKGLYAKARAGEIKNFTGIDAPFEVPKAAELLLDTQTNSVQALAQQVMDAVLEVKPR